MSFDATFWVALSFFIFIFLVAKPIGRAIGGALDNRSSKIKSELDDAMRLKEEAQAVLALYQRKQKKTLENSEEIIAHAKSEAERIIENAKSSIEDEIEKRTTLAVQKIAQTEARVVQEIRENAVDITISAAREIIMEDLDKDVADSVIDTAISDIGRKLN